MSQITNPYQSFEEISALVQSFESCEIKPADFDHRAHLIVALSYLSQSSSIEESARKIRTGLQRFLDHYKLQQAYNETITIFWLKVLKCFMDRNNNESPFAELVNKAVKAHSNPKIIFQHYSHEILMSEEAKTGWVEPDLKPIVAKSL